MLFAACYSFPFNQAASCRMMIDFANQFKISQNDHHAAARDTMILSTPSD